MFTNCPRKLSVIGAAALLVCIWVVPIQAKEVNVKEMPGFKASHATKALQAALDSGADKVIVPNIGKPWIVTPIQLRSNQTVVFKPGVVILAKKGAFRSAGASLFTAKGVKNLTIVGYGATWRMRKQDYAHKPYQKSEWRMGLSIRGCTNVTVEGLAIEKSGGDGIYIRGGAGKAYSENITIRNLICDDNYRQGISVISVDHLLMENVVMQDTGGTNPMAGIDFEPNTPSDRLTHIVMRNCLTRGNEGNGYQLALGRLDRSSEPVTINFKKCRSIRDGSNAVKMNVSVAKAPRGRLVFTDCIFRNSRNGGIRIKKPSEGFKVTFRNCILDRPTIDSNDASPIIFIGSSSAAKPVGGVSFENFRIIDPKGRQPINYVMRSANAPLKNITGTLTVSDSRGTRTLPLTKKLLDRWIQDRNFEHVPYVSLDEVQWLPRATLGGRKIKLGKGKIRHLAKFALYAEKGDRVQVNILYGRIGHKQGKSLPVTVTSPSGKTVYSGEVSSEKVSPMSFTAPTSGIFLLSADPRTRFIRIESSTNPLSIITPKDGFDFYRSKGSYFFWVPTGTKQFAVQGVAQGKEGLRMILKRPNGTTVKDIDNILGLRQITVIPKSEQTGKIWELQIKPASDVIFEDHSVKLLGIPPLIAGRPKAVIRSKGSE